MFIDVFTECTDNQLLAFGHIIKAEDSTLVVDGRVIPQSALVSDGRLIIVSLCGVLIRVDRDTDC